LTAVIINFCLLNMGGGKMGKSKSTNLNTSSPKKSGQSHQDVQKPNFRLLLLGAIIGFALGVLGNLIAAWVLNDVWDNKITFPRLALLVALTVMGLILAALVDRVQQTSHRGSMVATTNDASWFSALALFWSRIRSRGRGIRVKDVFALGSEIDVDTRSEEN
jgi:hypothetical protein